MAGTRQSQQGICGFGASACLGHPGPRAHFVQRVVGPPWCWRSSSETACIFLVASSGAHGPAAWLWCLGQFLVRASLWWGPWGTTRCWGPAGSLPSKQSSRVLCRQVGWSREEPAGSLGPSACPRGELPERLLAVGWVMRL